jgi:hypothetical protein
MHQKWGDPLFFSSIYILANLKIIYIIPTSVLDGYKVRLFYLLGRISTLISMKNKTSKDGNFD